MGTSINLITWSLLQVRDHMCPSNEKGMTKLQIQMHQQVFNKKESGHLNWESHDGFKHYNLSKLIIEGFEVEEKFHRMYKTSCESSGEFGSCIAT